MYTAPQPVSFEQGEKELAQSPLTSMVTEEEKKSTADSTGQTANTITSNIRSLMQHMPSEEAKKYHNRNVVLILPGVDEFLVGKSFRIALEGFLLAWTLLCLAMLVFELYFIVIQLERMFLPVSQVFGTNCQIKWSKINNMIGFILVIGRFIALSKVKYRKFECWIDFAFFLGRFLKRKSLEIFPTKFVYGPTSSSPIRPAYIPYFNSSSIETFWIHFKRLKIHFSTSLVKNLHWKIELELIKFNSVTSVV